MKPIGWRKKQARQKIVQAMREAVALSQERARLSAEAAKLVTAAEEAGARSRASARDAERAIHFADSAWRQIEKIAKARGLSNRQAIAEALSVWEAVSPLLGLGDGPIEVRVRGKSCVILVRREHTAQTSTARSGRV